MREHAVDPRDTRWEQNHPSYRVYFWRPGITDEWELADADVDEVLSWAADHADGRQYVVYACIDSTEGLGLIRLFGADHP
jgi:hypothetical protein